MCRSTTNVTAPRMDLLFGDLQPVQSQQDPKAAATTEKKMAKSEESDSMPPPPAYEELERDEFANVDSAGVILATRYKTKMCLSIEQGEECPYQNRCMFAHSDEELRTKEQNLADGITTETAIREHRRRVHMQIKQRNKRKEKRREKQLKKQQLREMEAQGITLPEYWSPVPEQQQDSNSSVEVRQYQQEDVYRHDPYAFPFSASTSTVGGALKKQFSFGGADSEGQSAGGETDSHHNDSGAPSPRYRSSSSSSCIISFDSADFYRQDASCFSSGRCGGWSHNPYPKVIIYQE